MNKKLMILTLATFLSFTLLACGGNNKETESTTTEDFETIEASNDDPDTTSESANEGNIDTTSSADAELGDDDLVVKDLDGWTTEVDENLKAFAQGVFFRDEMKVYEALKSTNTYIPSLRSMYKQIRELIDTTAQKSYMEVVISKPDNYRMLFKQDGKSNKGFDLWNFRLQDRTDSQYDPAVAESFSDIVFSTSRSENGSILINDGQTEPIIVTLPYETTVKLNGAELPLTSTETRVHPSHDVEQNVYSYSIQGINDGEYTISIEDTDLYEHVLNEYTFHHDSHSSELKINLDPFNGLYYAQLKPEHEENIQKELTAIYTSIFEAIPLSWPPEDTGFIDEDKAKANAPSIEGISDELAESIYLQMIESAGNIGSLHQFESIPVQEMDAYMPMTEDRLYLNFDMRYSQTVSSVIVNHTTFATAVFDVVEEGGSYTFKLVELTHKIG